MLNSGTIQHLENALNYRTANHEAIANNISNADTPNYKAKSVEFRETLNSSLKAYRTDQKHIPFSTEAPNNPSFLTRTNTHTSYSHNGNNVDVDKEMSKLAENQLYYQALIQRMNGKFNSINTVIKGGR
ncbi:flagellar basal body rod protein FlgB [Pseudalkalibacillus salsuginis]|uniref:flagellar basal body rod protein FlgB n=1 Tax=Pseudalkalibacillus salsuginis TaxID=2910972 RepID=UPI001F2D539D|nr:flagellar basal body rod protein FlgB [Pseudalkalibacillus salsuginis]MCF6410561.1 flagellar basal body rod protein FlgB [Pseudalkalibacillus salsuginis]